MISNRQTYHRVSSQVKHAEDLESVRKAGHEALCIIVEEYKVRTCVCRCVIVIIVDNGYTL